VISVKTSRLRYSDGQVWVEMTVTEKFYTAVINLKEVARCEIRGKIRDFYKGK